MEPLRHCCREEFSARGTVVVLTTCLMTCNGAESFMNKFVQFRMFAFNGRTPDGLPRIQKRKRPRQQQQEEEEEEEEGCTHPSSATPPCRKKEGETRFFWVASEGRIIRVTTNRDI